MLALKNKFHLYKLAVLSVTCAYFMGGQLVLAESLVQELSPDTVEMIDVSFEIDTPEPITIQTHVPLTMELPEVTSATEVSTPVSSTEAISSIFEETVATTKTAVPVNPETSATTNATVKPAPKPTPVPTTVSSNSSNGSTPSSSATVTSTESKNSSSATTQTPNSSSKITDTNKDTNSTTPSTSPTLVSTETNGVDASETTLSPGLTPTPTVTPTPTPVPVDDSLTGLVSVNIPLTDAYSIGPRLTAPTKDNAYYFSSNSFARAGFPMPNCTTYVYGRAWEMLGSKPRLSSRDAHYFWGDNIRDQVYAYGQEPKVGAIACWNSGEFGHVAIVEEVGPNMILISESFWKGMYFNTRWIPKKTPSLQGYIYLANFTNEVFSEKEENKDFVARVLTQDGKKALAADGRSIVLQDANVVSSEQYWRISLSEDGYYEVRNANGFVLDVAGALDRDGVSIQLDDKTSSKGQGWKISILNKLVRFEPQYTERKISVINDSQVQIYSEGSAAELEATQFFSLDRIELPELKVLPSLRTNVVNFKLDNKVSDATESYLKIYKEAFGKGSAVIEPIKPGETVSIALDPGYYEVCIEMGAGQALSSSEIQSFSLAVSNTDKFLAR